MNKQDGFSGNRCWLYDVCLVVKYTQTGMKYFSWQVSVCVCWENNSHVTKAWTQTQSVTYITHIRRAVSIGIRRTQVIIMTLEGFNSFVTYLQVKKCSVSQTCIYSDQLLSHHSTNYSSSPKLCIPWKMIKGIGRKLYLWKTMALRGIYVKPEFCCTLRVSGRSSFTDKLAFQKEAHCRNYLCSCV